MKWYYPSQRSVLLGFMFCSILVRSQGKWYGNHLLGNASCPKQYCSVSQKWGLNWDAGPKGQAEYTVILLSSQLNSGTPHHHLWDFTVGLAVSTSPLFVQWSSVRTMSIVGLSHIIIDPACGWLHFSFVHLGINVPWFHSWERSPQSIFMNRLLPYADRVNWSLEATASLWNTKDSFSR